MRQLKIVFLFAVVASLFLTSCQKEQQDRNFEQTIVEQSEEIVDTPENLELDKTAPEPSEKQLETSGMKGYNDRPESKKMPKEATARSLQWISCGQTKHGSNFGHSNYFNGHDYMRGCLSEYYAFDAPDRQYMFNVPRPMTITFELSNLTRDLDLFIFSGGWDDCYGYSINSNLRNESITLYFNPGTYVAVIDGYIHSMQGQYTLKMICEDGCENFDNYHNGNISSQSSKWRKFYPSATFDGKVTSNRSYSGHRSLYIDHKSGYSDRNQMDVVRKIGEYSSGKHYISWKMYVPHNRNAAFNFQKYQIPGLQVGLAIYMKKGEGIAIRANNRIYQSSKKYRQGTWVDVSVDYDLNGGMAVLSIDNQIIAAFNTRTRANTVAQGANRLGGVNFWAYHDYTTFYVDDFCIEDWSGLQVLYNFDPATLFIDL